MTKYESGKYTIEFSMGGDLVMSPEKRIQKEIKACYESGFPFPNIIPIGNANLWGGKVRFGRGFPGEIDIQFPGGVEFVLGGEVFFSPGFKAVASEWLVHPPDRRQSYEDYSGNIHWLPTNPTRQIRIELVEYNGSGKVFQSKSGHFNAISVIPAPRGAAELALRYQGLADSIAATLIPPTKEGLEHGILPNWQIEGSTEVDFEDYTGADTIRMRLKSRFEKPRPKGHGRKILEVEGSFFPDEIEL